MCESQRDHKVKMMYPSRQRFMPQVKQNLKYKMIGNIYGEGIN